MSSWATAFNSRSIVGVSIPLFRPRGNSIRGYFGVEQPNVIPLEYGSFAVNLNVARWMQSQNGLWKLTVDGRFRTNDLNLNMTDIEGPCGNECSNNVRRNKFMSFISANYQHFLINRFMFSCFADFCVET